MFDFIHPAVFWVLIGVAASGLLLLVASWFVASYLVYKKTLGRGSKDRWNREIPEGIPADSLEMYQTGFAWAAENAEKKQDVHIVRDGCNLYGEYYDFGYDRCAVILSGRTESLIYGYYFAIPYSKNGCNILVIDPRAHGLSDGEYNTVGFEESVDDIAWLNHISEKFGIKSFVLHGICIGAAGGILAITNDSCPKIVDGIVAEGMFPCFYESVRNNMIEKKRARFVTLDLIDAWMRHYTGHTMKIGPIDFIDKLDVPLLMLHSREDLYSKPEFAKKLFEKAGSKNKKIVWFDSGRHSFLRITHTEKYDASIAEFLNTLPVKTKK